MQIWGQCRLDYKFKASHIEFHNVILFQKFKDRDEAQWQTEHLFNMYMTLTCTICVEK